MTADTRFEIGIIGAGIMGEALLVAISKAGVSAANIAISDKRAERTNELSSKYGCNTRVQGRTQANKLHPECHWIKQ